MLSNKVYIIGGAVISVLFVALALAEFSTGYPEDGLQDLLYAVVSAGAGALLYVLDRRQRERRAAAEAQRDAR
ncbi:hypothetical protein [Amycolatopsis keratiniphila]|uniref:Uncharacterized protein n=1 Tax=Amycolatopsis keratiniphila subsp. keratiniphila TaxID=227715 RepID=A0A1W2LR57_9PSEU|nr:hypothetical protein [Amycolatopsis keratiniphila]OLZ59708.1 hypothetical protein BS330_04875 [Amycolatopsis keratiniphila subsp. nogabecina]ONF66819.1 hypothetical protein AVR91_0222895 [Amycolatopsis keratiniphila subsp. keratiniphila]SDU54909.1 hypothetical protein SAMN04489733_5888 [Amycolatopsis keratiniphila]